jgi:hypothetical protein
MNSLTDEQLYEAFMEYLTDKFKGKEENLEKILEVKIGHPLHDEFGNHPALTLHAIEFRKARPEIFGKE